MNRAASTALLALLCISITSCGGDISQANPPSAPLTVAAAESTLRLPRCPTAPHPLRKISSLNASNGATIQPDQPVTLRGVVTADFAGPHQLHGFFMQQPDAARASATSAGIFVTLSARAKRLDVGRYVQVSGLVGAAKGKAGDAANSLRLMADDISDCGEGQPIKPHQLQLPVTNLRQLSALDGMLISIEQPMSVSDNHQLGLHGELQLAANDRLWQPFNHPELSDPDLVADLNERAQIILGDGSMTLHPNPIPYLNNQDSAHDTALDSMHDTLHDSRATRRTGDVVRGLRGILTRSSGAWHLQPLQPPQFSDANPRPAAPAPIDGNLRVASMNVLSYFTTLGARGAKSAAELVRQRDKLVSAIEGLNADVLGLMEIENTPDSLNNLLQAINARLGDQQYAAIDSGIQGSDDIKVAILYKPARVRALDAPVLFDATGPDGGISARRPPLGQRFSVRASGTGFWFVATHLKSKSRCPSTADSNDRDRGQGCWNATRIRQARVLRRWTSALRLQSNEPNLLILGDLNAYLNETPVQTLEQAGFEALVKRLPPAQRYSYVFAGRSGVLDHAFASAAIRSQVRSAAIWHINADEPAVFDYTIDKKPDDRYAPSPFRASDHDPIWVDLQL
jgi:predicted extracellular nuclease